MQKYIELQLEYMHMSELAETVLVLHYDKFINRIINCTGNPVKVQVNPLQKTFYINVNNGRDLNMCMY